MCAHVLTHCGLVVQKQIVRQFNTSHVSHDILLLFRYTEFESKMNQVSSLTLLTYLEPSKCLILQWMSGLLHRDGLWPIFVVLQLTEVNDRMSDYMQNLSVNSQSAALLHTLQRHRDILQDYSHEFQKTKANIITYKEREELLGSVRRDIEWVRESLLQC